jgi:hypothetical protein
LVPEPPDDEDDDDAVEVLDDPPAEAFDADVAEDDDELDPHPAMTATSMATAIAPAPRRARSDLNMVPLLLSKRPRAGPR